MFLGRIEQLRTHHVAFAYGEMLIVVHRFVSFGHAIFGLAFDGIIDHLSILKLTFILVYDYRFFHF